MYAENALNEVTDKCVIHAFDVKDRLCSEIDNAEDLKVVKKVWPMLEEEAKRVVNSMPKWIPATMGEKPVRCRFSLPIVFRIKK